MSIIRSLLLLKKILLGGMIVLFLDFWII